MRRFAFSIPSHAARDPLTGLFDRRSVFDALDSDEMPAIGLGAAVVIDLDRFSHVNHSLGYGAGDTVLRTIALRLMARLRVTDQVARLGSDEFLVLLAAPVNVHSATEVAGRLIEYLALPIRIGDQEVVVTASAGVAMRDEQDRDPEDLVRRAASAARTAKAGGAGRMSLASAADALPSAARLELEAGVRRAFEHRQLEVHYQPEVDLRTRQVLGAEALVRWRHPDHGLLAASEFIDVVEDTGLASRLGTWVLGQAFAHANGWDRTGGDRTIRVNLSATQLMDDTIVIDVREALADNEIEPDQVCLEVTESHLLDDLDESLITLRRLKDLGVRLAVDDFGTGFNSMSYLKTLPIDVLKIDRSFVAGVGIDSGDTAIVESIIRLGAMLDLTVVAEGIEHEHQAEALLALGCVRAQGYHLGKPVPGIELLDRLG